VSILFASALGFLAYLAASSKQTEAFNWMLALSGLSSLFTWSSICLAHIRFRAGWKKAGHTLDELAFRSQPGVIGSWIGLIFNCLVLVVQFWTGFAPVGYAEMTAGERVENFFMVYLAAPIIFISYFGYKFWMRTKIVRSADMDVVTGRRELNVAELIAEERAERATWPAWKRWYKFFC